jgi:hypothetical protein
MREPVTMAVVVRELRRLNVLFAKFSAAELEAVARGYHEALSDLDAEQLAGATTVAMREETRFPAPATLRTHARSWRQANRPEIQVAARPINSSEPDAPVCRQCGARPRLAWIEGRAWKDGKISDEVFHVKRYIAPCDPSRHGSTGFVPYPPTFHSWAE